MASTRQDLRFTAMRLLAAYPDGIAVHDFFDALEQAAALPLEMLESTPDNPKVKRYQRDLWFGLIAPTKAGWLTRGDGIWRITDAGREALVRWPDAQSFAKVAPATRSGRLPARRPAGSAARRSTGRVSPTRATSWRGFSLTMRFARLR